MTFDTISSLIGFLREQLLLDQAQIAQLDEASAQFQDPRELGRELVRRGWLTPYQVNQLFLGRSRDLLLGPYRLLEPLGEGGMGQVFKARHQKLGRVVALKVIRKERLSHSEAVRRFQREAKSVARLSHPNIVAIHDTDEIEGTHYLAMEFIEGVDLSRLLKESGPLPIGLACDCIRQTALALQHAHEKGMVHRDIKPGNLLLSRSGVWSPESGVQSSSSSSGGLQTRDSRLQTSPLVKLLDLGLARVRHGEGDGGQSTSLTEEGTVMGTPDYIAPEQAVSSHGVDIRADIYSLGCTLYHLLTGRVPFPGGTLIQKLDKHRWQEPTPIEQIRPEVPADVIGVVKKMMGKRLQDRYQTPIEVAVALEPHCSMPADWRLPSLTARPSASLAPPAGEAAPQSPWQPAAGPEAKAEAETPGPAWAGTSAFTRGASPLRHPGSASNINRKRFAAAAVITGVVVGVAVLIVALALSNGERKTSEPPPSPPAVAPLSFQVDATKPWQDTGIDLNEVVLASDLPVRIRVTGRWKMKPAMAECTADGYKDVPKDRTIKTDANAMCLLGRVGASRPYELGQNVPPEPKQRGRLFVMANDLDLEDNSGTLTLEIVQGGKKGDKPADPPPPTVREVEELERRKRLAEADAALKKLSTEADAAFHLVAGKAPAKPDLEARRKELLDFRVKFPGTPAAQKAAEMLTKLPSPLDQLDPAKIPEDAKAYLKEVGFRENEVVAVFGEHVRRHLGAVRAVAVSPDDNAVISLGHNQVLQRFDWTKGGSASVAGIRGHKSRVRCAAFSSDGHALALGGGGESVDQPNELKVWRSHEPRELVLLKTGVEQVVSVGFAQGGQRLVAVAYGGLLKMWDVSTGEELKAIDVGIGWPGANPLSVAADGKSAVVGCVLKREGDIAAYGVKHVDLSTGKVRTLLEGPPVAALVLSPEGRTLATAHASGDLRLWDVATGKERVRIPVTGYPRFHALVFASDGGRLAVGGGGGRLTIWDVLSTKLVADLRGHADGYWNGVHAAAFSTDGNLLVSGDDTGAVRLWDLKAGKEVQPLTGPVNWIEHSELREFANPRCLYLRTSGRYLATERDGTLKLVGLDQVPRELGKTPPGAIAPVAVAPDGQLALVIREDNSIADLDLETGKEIQNLVGHTSLVTDVRFSPDCRQVLSGSTDSTVRLWDRASGKELFQIHTGGIVHSVAFLPDGRHVLTSGVGGVRLWNLERRTIVRTYAGTQGSTWMLDVAPDGRFFVSADDRHGPIVWRVDEEKPIRQWQLPRCYSVFFASDGRHLATANANGTVYILRLAPPPDAKAAANAELTPANPEKLRQELLNFQRQFPGTPAALKAARQVKELPSPLDRFDPAKIPQDAKEAWKAAGFDGKGVVAVLGEHRRRNWGAVDRVAHSPDGKMIASREERVVRLWDADSGKPLRTLVGHSDECRQLAFHNDGRVLASAWGPGVKLWDVETGKELQGLNAHAGVASMALSPDGRWLATGGTGDHQIALWDAQTRKWVAFLKGHKSWVMTLAFDREGRLLASGSRDNSVRLWNAETRELLRVLFDEPEKAGNHDWQVALSPDGRLLAGVCPTVQGVKLWDTASGKEQFTLKGHGLVAFNPDSRLVLANSGNDLQLWDAASGKEVRTIKGAAARAVAFSPDGRRVVTGHADGTLRFWDVESGAEIRPLAGPVGATTRLALSPDERSLATVAYAAKVLRVWDLTTAAERVAIAGKVGDASQTEWPYSVAFSPDGRWLATGETAGRVRIRDPVSGKTLRSVTAVGSMEASLSFSASGKILVIARGHRGNADIPGEVRLCDPATGKEVRTLPQDGPALEAVISPDGRLVASRGFERFVRIWDAESGKELHRLDAPRVQGLAFSPDGRHLLTDSDDSMSRLWDAISGKLVREYRGYLGGARQSAFTPDGDTFVSHYEPGKLVWWNTQTGTKLKEWQLPGGVRDLAFAPDGRHLFTANANGTVYVFRMPKPDDLGRLSAEDRFAPLFNGKDLTGWKVPPGQTPDWTVRDGVLTSGGKVVPQYLFSERGDIKDFHLRAELRINSGGNSGIFFRFASPTPKPIGCYGIDLGDGNTLIRGVFGVATEMTWPCPTPVDQWFTQEVVARGNHLVVRINGKTVADVTDSSPVLSAGHIALEQWSPGTRVEFRKIEIRDLP